MCEKCQFVTGFPFSPGMMRAFFWIKGTWGVGSGTFGSSLEFEDLVGESGLGKSNDCVVTNMQTRHSN